MIISKDDINEIQAYAPFEGAAFLGYLVNGEHYIYQDMQEYTYIYEYDAGRNFEGFATNVTQEQKDTMKLERSDVFMKLLVGVSRRRCQEIIDQIDIILLGLAPSAEQGVANMEKLKNLKEALKDGYINIALYHLENLAADNLAGFVSTSFESRQDIYDDIHAIFLEKIVGLTP